MVTTTLQRIVITISNITPGQETKRQRALHNPVQEARRPAMRDSWDWFRSQHATRLGKKQMWISLEDASKTTIYARRVLADCSSTDGAHDGCGARTTPFRQGALRYRLSPLGQTVLRGSGKLRCAASKWSAEPGGGWNATQLPFRLAHVIQRKIITEGTPTGKPLPKSARRFHSRRKGHEDTTVLEHQRAEGRALIKWERLSHRRVAKATANTLGLPAVTVVCRVSAHATNTGCLTRAIHRI